MHRWVAGHAGMEEGSSGVPDQKVGARWSLRAVPAAGSQPDEPGKAYGRPIRGAKMSSQNLWDRSPGVWANNAQNRGISCLLPVLSRKQC